MLSIKHKLAALALAVVATGVAILAAAPDAARPVVAAKAGPARASASAGPVTGSKKVAVILFNFTNNASQPYTPAKARGVFFDNGDSVSQYYRYASYGQLSLSGDVLGWYTLSRTDAGCEYWMWHDEAMEKARADGKDLSQYDYFVFGFPGQDDCHSGLYSGSSIYLEPSGMDLGTVAHELGHAFGLMHAGSLECSVNGVQVTLSANMANCDEWEYGDEFSVMGRSSSKLLHNWHRFQLGWLSNPVIVTASGTYDVYPVQGPSPDSRRLLRIPRPDGTYIDLEFRQAFWPFDTLPVVNGVTLRLDPEDATESMLLDTTPETATFTDAPLAVGRTFVDPLSQAEITTTAVSSTGATVSIKLSPPPDLRETDVSNWPASLNRGSWLSVTDTATNVGGGAAASTTRYWLSRDKFRGDDVLIYVSRSVPSLAPGASSSVTTEVIIPTTTPLGTYFLLACADDLKKVPESDESNNCQASQTMISVTAPDLKVMAVNNPPAWVLRGGSFSLGDTTTNVGSGPAGASTNRYYLSVDKVWDGGDFLLYGSREVAALSPLKQGKSSSSSGLVGLTVPVWTPLGIYYVLACADDLKKVPEKDEVNNCLASSGQVVVSQV